MYYIFNCHFNTKNCNRNKIKLDKNSYKNTLIYYSRYVAIKYSKFVKNDSINPLCPIYGGVNGYFEEYNGSKNLMQVTTNENKEIMNKCEELCRKLES